MPLFSSPPSSPAPPPPAPATPPGPFLVSAVSLLPTRESMGNLHPFEYVTEFSPAVGGRVRITLANGHYFILKLPSVYDGLYHPITTSSSHHLLIKFSLSPAPPSITFESALAKANAVVLLYSLGHSLGRREGVASNMGMNVDGIDFYLCCG